MRAASAPRRSCLCRKFCGQCAAERAIDRKSTRLNSSHLVISYAVFCLKKKKIKYQQSCSYRVSSLLDWLHMSLVGSFLFADASLTDYLQKRHLYGLDAMSSHLLDQPVI